MNLIMVENIISWLLFALASTCTVSFAATLYDDFLSRRRHARDKNTMAKVSPPLDVIPVLPPPERFVTRGYDSPELFREDLWIRRIEQSRREHAARATSTPHREASFGADEHYPKRLCAMLANHMRRHQLR